MILMEPIQQVLHGNLDFSPNSEGGAWKEWVIASGG